MQTLKGKTILIGRQQGTNRLVVAVRSGNHIKADVLEGMSNVPDTVSRFRPNERKAHCKIDVDASGNMILQNLQELNTTSVDGMQIQSKRVNPGSRIGMGCANFEVPLNIILDKARKIAMPPVEKVCDIRPLRQVWDTYHDGMDNIKRRQQRINLWRSASPIFTLGAGALSAIVPEEIRPYMFILTGIGLVIMIVSFVMGAMTDNVKETNELTEYFQDYYVCPNTGLFMGNTPYKHLAKRASCPHCKNKHIVR